MTESEFNALAQHTLDAIAQSIEDSSADGECEWKGDGVLEIEFEDGGRIVVNRHAAAQEIWVAAKSGGHHFRFDGERWVHTREGFELFALLSRVVSEHSRQAVVLSARRQGR